MEITIFALFFILLFLGIPITFVLGITSLSVFLILQDPSLLGLIAQRLYSGADSFPLMAIPFFMLAGEIMSSGKITDAIVKLSNVLVGHLPGGLAHVTIVSLIFISGVSGSAVADAAAIGSILIPAMVKEKYDKGFSAAVTVAGSVNGPIIPPSIVMVVYAYTAGISLAGLFCAGFIPGIMIGISLMTIAYVICRKRKYSQRKQAASLKEIISAFREAFLSLLMVVIIIGGMVSGVFTPTEAAAVSVFYALFICFFVLKTLKLGDMPKILIRASIITGIILFVIGNATTFAWILARYSIPQNIVALFSHITTSPFLTIFMLNIFLLVVGMFMDISPAILILVPILQPVATAIGLHPLHFGIIVVVNLSIGIATPPYGVSLFVVSSMTGLPIEKIVREIWPFLIAEIVTLLLISYIPFFTMVVPKLAGYY